MVKRATMHNAKTKYEDMHMEERDIITPYMHKIDDVVNEIKSLGGALQKMLSCKRYSKPSPNGMVPRSMLLKKVTFQISILQNRCMVHCLHMK